MRPSRVLAWTLKSPLPRFRARETERRPETNPEHKKPGPSATDSMTEVPYDRYPLTTSSVPSKTKALSFFYSIRYEVHAELRADPIQSRVSEYPLFLLNCLPELFCWPVDKMDDRVCQKYRYKKLNILGRWMGIRSLLLFYSPTHTYSLSPTNTQTDFKSNSSFRQLPPVTTTITVLPRQKLSLPTSKTKIPI